MNEAMEDRRLVRLLAAFERAVTGRTTVYDMMTRGLFPTCVRAGVRAVAWRQSDLDGWVLPKRPGGFGEEANA